MGVAQANGIDITYEIHGDDGGIPLLLVHGLAMQLVHWHDDLIAALVARGYRVVRFDNRDIGLSTHLSADQAPDIMAALQGRAEPAYLLADLADDTAGLLDALGIASAHVLGVSMGGMIVQELALRHPDRVRSLTSIMSTSGDREASTPTPEAAAVLMQPFAKDRETFADQQDRVHTTIGSTGFPVDHAWVRERAVTAYDRAYDPLGVGRQLVAIYASGDRTPRLGAVSVPSLVVHGSVDPLIPIAAGRLTATTLDAELLEIEGMGHDLPREVWDRVLDALGDVVQAGEKARA